MMHKNRLYSLKDTTLEGAAQDLARMQWCCCQGFRVELGNYILLILNDATCEDGAQEYAFCHVLKRVGRVYTVVQGESVTISWIAPERIIAEIATWAAYPEGGTPFSILAETCDGHHCPLCA
jgi:hypothetical protein